MTGCHPQSVPTNLCGPVRYTLTFFEYINKYFKSNKITLFCTFWTTYNIIYSSYCTYIVGYDYATVCVCADIGINGKTLVAVDNPAAAPLYIAYTIRARICCVRYPALWYDHRKHISILLSKCTIKVPSVLCSVWVV